MEFIDVVGIMFSRQVTHTAYVSIIYTTIYVDVTCTHSSTLHIHSSLCIFDMCITVYIFKLSSIELFNT